MNRRTFLKTIATVVCGAAVVCPGELLKPAQRIYGVGWHDFNPFGSEAEYKKYRQNIFIKARQQGCTNSILYGIPYYFRSVKIHYQSPLYDETTQI